jgi:hypothetical protein
MSIRVAIDLDLFTVMAKEESHPRNSTHLAAMVGADPILLGMLTTSTPRYIIFIPSSFPADGIPGRLLRNMAAMDFIVETGIDTYELTPVSSSLLNQAHRDGFPFW